MVRVFDMDEGEEENESQGNEEEPELVLMALDDHLRRGSKFTAKVPPLLDDKPHGLHGKKTFWIGTT